VTDSQLGLPVTVTYVSGTFIYSSYNYITVFDMSFYVEDSQMTNISFVHQPQNKSAPSGLRDKIFLICIATGAGILSYTWLKDGVNISDSNVVHRVAAEGSVLFLTEITDGTQGVYTCVVESNETGEAIYSSAEFGVLGKFYV